MVSVVGLGGRGRRLVRVRIRARILVRITRSVCEVIFGVWRGEGEYWGFWGGHSETLLTFGGGWWSAEKMWDVGGCIYEA
jgi:hypothetical protein